MRRGTYPFQREAPLTPGYSVLGKVRVNGKGCTKFKVGDRVACLSKYDGQAELINLPERFLMRVPDEVDLKVAVALVLDWVTGYQMLHHAAMRQQQLANGGMWPAKSAPNLMQGLPSLPATPDIGLLRESKSRSFPLHHKHHL